MDRTAFVKVLGPAGDVAGNGFLLEGGLIATCAHVLRDAIGVDPSEMIDQQVSVEFHWTGGMQVMGKIVPGSVRYDRKGQDIGLIALDPPAGAVALRLSRTDRVSFDASAQPFFASLEGSLPITGKVIGKDENNRLILKVDISGELRVEPGNSGAAVFLRDGELVEAMLIQRDSESAQAFLMPAAAIALVAEQARADPSAAPLQTSRGTPRKSADDTDALIAAFCGADPVAGFGAIEKLAARGSEIVETLLTREDCFPKEVRMRDLVAAIGKDALPVLGEAIRTKPWGKKAMASRAFEAFRGDTAAHEVIWPLLHTFDVEITRNAIAAAGYAGYAATIAQDIANLAIYGVREPHMFSEPSSDYLNKLSGNALTAISMGYGYEPREFALEKIEEIAVADKEAHRFTHPPYDLVARGYHLFTPAALEAFSKTYGTAGQGTAIHVARAIGATRYERFAGHAIDLMLPKRSDDVQNTAAGALSRIGGTRAAEALHDAATALQLEQAWRAASTLYHHCDSWPDAIERNIAKAVCHPGEEGSLMRISVAMARRGLTAREARAKFDAGDNSIARASSALAYAILDKPGARDFLAGSHEEASDIAETVLLLCAQIIAGDHDKGGLLHGTLQSGDMSSWSLEVGHPFWRYIILACLAESEPSGARAAAWSREWRDTGAAVDRQIADFRKFMFYP